jgi:hypothetical protein
MSPDFLEFSLLNPLVFLSMIIYLLSIYGFVEISEILKLFLLHLQLWHLNLVLELLLILLI